MCLLQDTTPNPATPSPAAKSTTSLLSLNTQVGKPKGSGATISLSRATTTQGRPDSSPPPICGSSQCTEVTGDSPNQKSVSDDDQMKCFLLQDSSPTAEVLQGSGSASRSEQARARETRRPARRTRCSGRVLRSDYSHSARCGGIFPRLLLFNSFRVPPTDMKCDLYRKYISYMSISNHGECAFVPRGQITQCRAPERRGMKAVPPHCSFSFHYLLGYCRQFGILWFWHLPVGLLTLLTDVTTLHIFFI